MTRLRFSTRRSRSGPLNVGGGQWCERSLRVAPTSNVYHPRHVEDPSIAEGVVLHRVGDPRDDAARQRARRDQPVAGLPRLPGAGRDQGGGARRDRGRHQPVPAHVGRRAVPSRDRRAVPNPLRHVVGRPGTRGHGHLRLDRGDDRGDARRARPGRRGRRVRAVLRELRARRDPRGRRAADRDALAAGLDVRRGRARGRVQRAHARHHDQHAEQPDRQGVLARGARGDRRALPALGRGRVHRRDLRAHHVRRVPPRAARLGARARGPDRHDQRTVEDLQRDRLAGRLDRGARGAQRRDPQGARLPDGRRARAAAGGGRGRARHARVVLRANSRSSTSSDATRCSGSWRRRGSSRTRPAARTTSWPTSRTSGWGTTSRSPTG